MLLRKCGTNCPYGKAGDLMRGGVFARGSSADTLMIEAVGAADLPYSTTDGVLYEITSQGTYTLSSDIDMSSDETNNHGNSHQCRQCRAGMGALSHDYRKEWQYCLWYPTSQTM